MSSDLTNEEWNKLADVLTKAFEFAFNAHMGSYRKGTSIPYIVHPMEVASLLLKAEAPWYVVAAGFLHDVVEDTDIGLPEVEKVFGKSVARLVKGASEPEELTKGQPSEKAKTWKGRKSHTIEFIRTADKDMKLLSCADKLSNIRSMIEDHINIGDSLWNRFNASREKQKWYYTSMYSALGSGPHSISTAPIYKELKYCIDKLFGDKAK